MNSLNGKAVAFDALLDTGCSKTTVSKRIADALQLPIGSQGTAMCGGGSTPKFDSHVLISLGRSEVWDIDVDVMPTLPVLMLIGMDIISDGSLHLDRDNGGYWLTFCKK